MKIDTIFTNKLAIDSVESHLGLVKAGKICLGVQGDRLVIVQNPDNFLTKFFNFFKGISTDVKKVGVAYCATKSALNNDPRIAKLVEVNPILKNALAANKKLLAEKQDALQGQGVINGFGKLFRLI